MNSAPAILQLFFAVWLVFVATAATADNSSLDTPETGLPGIALIIDDRGNQHEQGKLVVRLPGPVAYSFLPYGPFTGSLAKQAHLQNKEVLLHLPMQAVGYERALDIARRQGVALGIGHPHAATLQVLREEIGNLKSQGVELMPAASLIELQNRRNEAWHAYLSR